MGRNNKKGSTALIVVLVVLLALGVGGFLMKDSIINLFASDQVVVMNALNNTIPKTEDKVSLAIDEIAKGSYKSYADVIGMGEFTQGMVNSAGVSFSSDVKKEEMLVDVNLDQTKRLGLHITNAQGAVIIGNNAYSFEGADFGKLFVAYLKENGMTDVSSINESLQLTYKEASKYLNSKDEEDFTKSLIDFINSAETTNEKETYDFNGKEIKVNKIVLNFKAEDVKTFMVSLIGDNAVNQDLDVTYTDVTADAYIYKDKIVKLDLSESGSITTFNFKSNDLETLDWTFDIVTETDKVTMHLKDKSTKDVVDCVVNITVNNSDKIDVTVYADTTKTTDNCRFTVKVDSDESATVSAGGDLVVNKNEVTFDVNNFNVGVPVPITMKFGIETLKDDIQVPTASENFFDKSTEELTMELYTLFLGGLGF